MLQKDTAMRSCLTDCWVDEKVNHPFQ
uniref:Uncharacterized protein n=1 Tax=Anguilla anguilla TaxID=7936 RepID=A0A0E9VGE4_ANGAN